ncbi:TPA: hypothetical protein DEX28_02405 [Patescibacteria group bacterium]|nr:MAG: hypothetical protein UW85_C0002G0010 [Parcubacteria group bacterium GW2011_GWA1_Parcubacteria_45_10]KKT88198.1 MAG: hypothetical protein UW89_C0010G0009 [Parcubacteria group bacterium GW2011_GWB1_45_10]HCI05576.1 hypothetical protein [Patescibacteria group bacterium]
METPFGILRIATPEQLRDFLEDKINSFRDLDAQEIEAFQKVMRVLENAIAGKYGLYEIVLGLDAEARKTGVDSVERVVQEAKSIIKESEEA